MFSAPRTLVWTASNGLYSHAGTCLSAAAWMIRSHPRVAWISRLPSRMSPRKKRRRSSPASLACISDCLSSSRLKTRMTFGSWRSRRCLMHRVPNEPVPPVIRMVLSRRSMRGMERPDGGEVAASVGADADSSARLRPAGGLPGRRRVRRRAPAPGPAGAHAPPDRTSSWSVVAAAPAAVIPSTTRRWLSAICTSSIGTPAAASSYAVMPAPVTARSTRPTTSSSEPGKGRRSTSSPASAAPPATSSRTPGNAVRSSSARRGMRSCAAALAPTVTSAVRTASPGAPASANRGSTGA